MPISGIRIPARLGAFAYFGLGPFSHWYEDPTRSDGKYIVIGEAASAQHAWIVGSLESALRGVDQFLWNHSAGSDAAALATQAYTDNKIPGPFGPAPAEYKRSDDIQIPEDSKSKVGPEVMPSPRGELAGMQVLLESISLKRRDLVIRVVSPKSRSHRFWNF